MEEEDNSPPVPENPSSPQDNINAEDPLKNKANNNEETNETHPHGSDQQENQGQEEKAEPFPPLVPIDLTSPSHNLPHSSFGVDEEKERSSPFFKRIFSCFSRSKKVHNIQDDLSVSSATTKAIFIPPVLPKNMPNAAEFMIEIDQMNERVRFGKSKAEYYLAKTERDELDINDFMIQSEKGMSYTQGI